MTTPSNHASQGFKDLVSPGVYYKVRERERSMKSVPRGQVDWPLLQATRTEKYSAAGALAETIAGVVGTSWTAVPADLDTKRSAGCQPRYYVENVSSDPD